MGQGLSTAAQGGQNWAFEEVTIEPDNLKDKKAPVVRDLRFGHSNLTIVTCQEKTPLQGREIFHRYLLTVCYVPGTVLEIVYITMNNTATVFLSLMDLFQSKCFQKSYSLRRNTF